MAILNILKIGIGAVGHSLLGKNKPLAVMLSVTNKCPFSCGFCNFPNRNGKELSFPEIKILIDQIAEAGTQVLSLWGGEPLLRDDIGEIIDYASAKKLMVTMDTTGYGIENKIDEISRLNKLAVSFDGPEDITEECKGKGSFKSTLTAIELASQRSIDMVSFTILTKYNIQYIDYILDTARQYGFKASFKIPHLNNTLGKNRNHFLADHEAYKNALKVLIKKKKKGEPVANTLNCLELLLTWPDFRVLNSENRNNGPKCMAGKLFCNIDTDGTVYACPGMVGSNNAKNFTESGFLNAFNQSGQKSCNSCSISFLIELNYLLSLNFFNLSRKQ